MNRVACITTVPTLTPRQQLQVKTLKETGFKIKVICWDRSGVHEREEEKNGIRFLRIYPWLRSHKVMKHSKQALSTLWGYSSEKGIKTIICLVSLWIRMFKKIIFESVDVIVCFHYALLPLAVVTGILKRAKIVYDIAEFNMDLIYNWLPSWARSYGAVIERFEDVCVRRVNGVTCIPDRRGFIFKRHYKNCKNIQVILNVPELKSRIESELYGELKKKYNKNYIIVYGGALKIDKGIEHALEAIKMIREKYRNIKLVLIGSCVGDDTWYIEKYVNENSLEDNVDIVTFQPYERLETFYACGHIGLNLPSYGGNPKRNLAIGTSRKNLDYLKASLPVIVPDVGEMGRLVREEQCGRIVEIWDGVNVAKAILFLLENRSKAEGMRKSGHKAFLAKYNWDIEKEKLLKVYQWL